MNKRVKIKRTLKASFRFIHPFELIPQTCGWRNRAGNHYSNWSYSIEWLFFNLRIYYQRREDDGLPF
jgi:hypothetical protein